jgi:predicted esterase
MIIVVVIALVLLSPQGRSGLHTILFVFQILESPIKPQQWLIKEPIKYETVYSTPVGRMTSDIYRIPDDQKRAGILLFLGANAAGKEDPDVIRLGVALARSGFVVMFHWSESMGLQNNLDPGEIENLVWAFQYLRNLKFVDQSRVGMGGFSVGGSFVLVAASDSRIRDDIAFVNSFGGYYDAHDLFLQIATKSIITSEKHVDWNVDKLTWLVFVNELIESLDDPNDKAILMKRYVENRDIVGSNLGQLSEEALRITVLIDGTSPDQAAVIISDLPDRIRVDLDRISPRNYLGDVTADILIMHDRGDTLIPVSESRKLSMDLTRRSGFHYTETSIFDHVRPSEPRTLIHMLKEGTKLVGHMYKIIRFTR